MSTLNRSMNEKSYNLPGIIVWVGILLILATGVIHFMEAPDNFSEAMYKGVLFTLNGVGALIAAVGIYRGSRSWGWGLGVVIAAGAVVGYVMSRTVGLPGLPVDDEWFEPIGVLSIIVELGFVAVWLWSFTTAKRVMTDQ